MEINEALEADWIQIRAILKAQIKRLESSGKSGVNTTQAMARAQQWVGECEKVIRACAVKA